MKSRKLVKILGAGGLALFMGVGTLCGVLIAPVAGATASSSSAQLGDSALTPEEQAKAELDANIINSGSKGLGLDPENDPIVATTDWGLDIQFHAAGEWTTTGYKSSQKTSNGNIDTDALKGYCYFTGGNYDGVTGLKWVIIGYSPTVITSTSPIWAKNIGIPDTTDAGNALKSASSKGTLIGTSYKIDPIYTNAVSNAEIPAGCVLCISEKNLLNAVYTSAYSSDAGDGYRKGARWVHSDLRTTMYNLYEEDITSFDTIRAKIQPVDLDTYSYRYNTSTDSCAIEKDESEDDYFFALANSTYITGDAVIYNPSTYPQNYRLETYLGATYASHASKRISYTHNTTTASTWWLRSGSSSNYRNAGRVHTTGFVDSLIVSNSYGVRPAFVLNVCT